MERQDKTVFFGRGRNLLRFLNSFFEMAECDKKLSFFEKLSFPFILSVFARLNLSLQGPVNSLN